MNIKLGFVLLCLSGIALFISFHILELSKKSALEPTPAAALLSVDVPLALDMRLKSAGCVAAGPLPDHDCTPGEVFTEAGLDDICTPGYASSARNVSVTLKKKVYSAYDIAYPQAKGEYEVDHLIPLELGGDNSIANLFPESAEPTPGFHEKDLVENYLHDQACAGAIPLHTAQMQIATNWLLIYNALTPEEIKQLKAEFSAFGGGQ